VKSKLMLILLFLFPKDEDHLEKLRKAIVMVRALVFWLRNQMRAGLLIMILMYKLKNTGPITHDLGGQRRPSSIRPAIAFV
jgi:hypothetical protein